jgi:hypothetical protein
VAITARVKLDLNNGNLYKEPDASAKMLKTPWRVNVNRKIYGGLS